MPKRTGMSEAVIAARALVLVDEIGLDGLSMRRLATALDVSAMTLYSYFADREALLDAVTQLLYAEIVPPAPGAGPREELRGLMHAVRRVLHAHPRALPLVSHYPPRTVEALAFVNAGFRAVLDAGVSPLHAARCYRALAAYSIGTATVEISGYFGQGPGPHEPPGPGVDPVALQEALPEVALVAPLLAGLDDVEEFDYGLDLTLDGFLRRHAPD
jgi:AcrR family transcriptional regulator